MLATAKHNGVVASLRGDTPGLGFARRKQWSDPAQTQTPLRRQFTPEEYPAKKNWGYCTYEYAVDLAGTARVRQLEAGVRPRARLRAGRPCASSARNQEIR